MSETIVLDAALQELLKDDAQREDRTLTELVNEAVVYYIRQWQQKKLTVKSLHLSRCMATYGGLTEKARKAHTFQ